MCLLSEQRWVKAGGTSPPHILSSANAEAARPSEGAGGTCRHPPPAEWQGECCRRLPSR